MIRFSRWKSVYAMCLTVGAQIYHLGISIDRLPQARFTRFTGDKYRYSIGFPKYAQGAVFQRGCV